MIMDSSESCEKLPISVVIVNYNAGPILTTCVQAVLCQAEEVIVVDNGSRDGSLECLAQNCRNLSNLRIIPMNRNLGFAAACNHGAAAATTPNILFLNPDCVVGRDALARMTAVLHSAPDIGMVGGFLANPDGTEQAGGRRLFPTPKRAFVRVFGLYRFKRLAPKLFQDFSLNMMDLPDKPIDIEAVSGACMLVKREALDNVGLFDERYFFHCEDLDLCMRFWKKGWRVMFVPDAPVIHDKGVCSLERPIFTEWHKHKGMLRFYRKFFHRVYPKILWPFIIAGVWTRFTAVILDKAAKSAWMRARRSHE